LQFALSLGIGLVYRSSIGLPDLAEPAATLTLLLGAEVAWPMRKKSGT